MKRSKSFKKIIVSLIVIGAVSIAVTQSSFYRRISQSQRLFNQIYNQIFSTYLHELNPEEFTKATINSITANLDPYTSYMVEEEQHQMNILSKGKYGGVGIQLSYRNEQMIVIAPMDGGPAQTAGILSGDIILKVDDAFVKDMTFNDAAAKIRGLKGSEVVLTIKRYGEDDPIDYKLIRSNIKVKDITYSGMVSPTTGYIRLNRFSRNTTSEMNQAFEALIESDVKEVIIDLRDNGGGLLTAAVNMIDMLIEKGQTIVSTKGRMKESNRSFSSRTKPIIDKDVKIAILINQGSASASEIVAGSIQDLDRGIVIGRKSFGKGLVQTLYPIDKIRFIADRFLDSTLAYQGGGRKLDLSWLIDLNNFATNKTFPDVTFFIDIEPEIGAERIGNSKDRIESAGLEFQSRVRQSYIKLSRLFNERYVTIDGNQDKKHIHKKIVSHLLEKDLL